MASEAAVTWMRNIELFGKKIEIWNDKIRLDP